jgi:hypothetical protein
MMMASSFYTRTQKQHRKRRLKMKKLNHLHMMHWVFVKKTQTQHTEEDFKRGEKII